MAFNSNNPFLNKTFKNEGKTSEVHQATLIDGATEMTLSGTINRSLILFLLLAATLAIATYYLFSWLFSMFTSFTPIHHGNSWISIGISVFVIVIAALNLFLDFDRIEQGVNEKMPKYMEWYGAMGLLITLVWLYIEFLRLLSKISSKD